MMGCCMANLEDISSILFWLIIVLIIGLIIVFLMKGDLL